MTTATERVIDGFRGLGFDPEPAGPGFDTDALIGQIPGNGAAFIYAVDGDGESTGYPRAGTPCCVETYDHDANMGERITFPDPVTAFVYVRDLSGWFAPLTATGERAEPRGRFAIASAERGLFYAGYNNTLASPEWKRRLEAKEFPTLADARNEAKRYLPGWQHYLVNLDRTVDDPVSV